MSTIHPKDRASLCSFTFADGRRCRTPRYAVHAQLCYFHARKQVQVQAAKDFDRQWASLISNARKQGHLSPKDACVSAN
jgi:hypothetical protein